MLLTTKGVIIGERAYGENDKFIDILTHDRGIIEAAVRGGRKLNSKNASSTGLFCYSKLCLDQKKGRYFLNSSEPINIFYNLRFDVEKIALASYFAQLLKYSIMSEDECETVLKLMLNTLYFLNEDNANLFLLKSVFEFRLLCEIGMIPNLLGCCECGVYENEAMFFDIKNAKLFCENCFLGSENYNNIKIGRSLLAAIRHIALSDFNLLFSVKISDRLLKELNMVTERYLKAHFDRNFTALDYFKSLTGRD